jgi:hypothetical protein
VAAAALIIVDVAGSPRGRNSGKMSRVIADAGSLKSSDDLMKGTGKG